MFDIGPQNWRHHPAAVWFTSSSIRKPSSRLFLPSKIAPPQLTSKWTERVFLNENSGIDTRQAAGSALLPREAELGRVRHRGERLGWIVKYGIQRR